MTLNILRIDASARKSQSVSRELADSIIGKFSDATVTIRDLTNAIPQLDEAWVGANFTPVDDRTAEQKETLALSDTLVAELIKADTLVISLPIYNFGVPASFKAWVDQIARAGITFQYGENGPEGLLSGKRAIIAVASGGVPVGSDYDHATPFVRQVLGFIGITDVEFVGATGLASDPDAALKAANDQIANLKAA